MPARLAAILKLQVPVIVQIGQRTMPVQDVMSLVPGAIIELPKTSDEELDLLVNNQPIGSGTAVKVGENFGLRVSFVGDLAERVSALAGDEKPAETAAENSADKAAPQANEKPAEKSAERAAEKPPETTAAAPAPKPA